MIINLMKGKQLTNIRTQGTDENVVLTPVRQMSIAEQLSMLNTDEALEITPKSLRLRKAILNPLDRKKSENGCWKVVNNDTTRHPKPKIEQRLYHRVALQ